MKDKDFNKSKTTVKEVVEYQRILPNNEIKKMYKELHGKEYNEIRSKQDD